MSGVSVLHHDDKPRPAVGQVVTGHPLPPLREDGLRLVTAVKVQEYSKSTRGELSLRYLVSFSFSLRQLDDGVGDGGAGGAHLLHHHQSGAVDRQHVTRSL